MGFFDKIFGKSSQSLVFVHNVSCILPGAMVSLW